MLRKKTTMGWSSAREVLSWQDIVGLKSGGNFFLPWHRLNC